MNLSSEIRAFSRVSLGVVGGLMPYISGIFLRVFTVDLFSSRRMFVCEAEHVSMGPRLFTRLHRRVLPQTRQRSFRSSGKSTLPFL